MIDSTDAQRRSRRRSRTARASRSSTRSTSRTARSASSSVVPLARTLRRGARRRLHRRGQGAGAGGHARAQARDRRALVTTCSRRSTASRAEDIIFDPLVFPCGTGDQNYVGARRRDDRGHPADQGGAAAHARRSSASRNVSFGLPAAGREVLNSVFLYHCVQAGLDLAIVNSEKLERYAVDPRGGAAARRGPASGGAATTRSPRSPRTSASAKPQRQEGARRRCRSTSGSRATSSRARRTASSPTSTRRCRSATPLEIINGPLMEGMDEVGRLFNANELIVAEVLQSAEAMKAAVAHLEPFMEKADTASRGQDRARHRQGRRPRHRQEPGRDHPRQQRLPRRQPRHQGAARGADARVPRAQAGRDRALGPAREVGAADGDHRGGPDARRASTARSWSAAPRSPTSFTRTRRSRPAYERHGRLRAGRDDRASTSPTSSWTRRGAPRSTTRLARETASCWRRAGGAARRRGRRTSRSPRRCCATTSRSRSRPI